MTGSAMIASTPHAILRAVSHRMVVGFAAASTALAPLAYVPPAFASDAVVQAGTGSQTIRLGLNKTKVIVLSADAHDVLVANPAVADAVTRDARRIYVFGKQVGETNIVVFDAQNRQIASINLKIERDISGLEASIRKYVSGSDVHVDMINDNVVLNGTVQTPQDAAKVERLAKIFVSGGEATTGRYIQSQAAPGGQGGNGDVAFAQEQRQTSQVINLLQIMGEDQVTLKVTVAEVKRDVLKQLGFDNLIQTSGSIATKIITQNNPIEGLLATSAQGTGNSATLNGGDVSSTVRAMEQAEVIRTLAEPTLTAISGESADFRVGGTVYLNTSDDLHRRRLRPDLHARALWHRPQFHAGRALARAHQHEDRHEGLRAFDKQTRRGSSRSTTASPILRLNCRPAARSSLPASSARASARRSLGRRASRRSPFSARCFAAGTSFTTRPNS